MWLDTGPPAQFTFGTGGAPGPARTTFADTGGSQVNQTASAQSYDTTINIKVAGTIVLALVVVFALQQLGFRFVVAAGAR